ncbi:MAG: response regulator [Rhodocyclaceae bacterium]|nr:response regulator [Rhodocyclaceae bacterium]MCB1902448.1 response regulator [Rhodocyclaceae bacterium]MCP5307986.1 response regulator [Zoogloeaceae bacterium]
MLVALLPACVLAILMLGYFTSARLSEIEQVHIERGRAFARQLAVASEFGVFSANREILQLLTNAALQEADVRGVTITDRQGNLLAASGEVSAAHLDKPGSADLLEIDNRLLIGEPVRASRLVVNDELSEILAPETRMADKDLGRVTIDFSLERLAERRTELLSNGILGLVVVLAGAILLARKMSHSVSGPIREVADAVTRIGHGEFSERVQNTGGGSLQALADGVNEMASRLEAAYHTMEQRVTQATAELRTRKEDAERANLAKSRFLAAASHDLRQPMHALVLFISELSSRNHPPETRRLVRQIAASAEAMENLLDSLLDISKLDAGVLQPEIRPFAVQGVFDRLAADFRPVADDRGLRLRIRPTTAWALSDPTLLERILLNLLSNALRYTARGTVMLACRRSGDHLRIEVRDSGMGIPRDAQEIIFQEFVQLDNPERARHKGLGLGLAIVRRLTELLGHPLSLRSAHGRGSMFTVELPRSEPQEERATEESPRIPGSLAGLTIAAVDDDQLALSSLNSLLSSWGCNVVAAESLERLQMDLALDSVTPRALVSDFRLRGSYNGIEVIHAMRRRFGEDLPAILITGDTGAATLQLAQAHKIALLHKPVRPAKLRALLQRQINAPEDVE